MECFLVEALLDELDNTVALTPAPVVEKRSVIGRSGVLYDDQPSKTGKYMMLSTYIVVVVPLLACV